MSSMIEKVPEAATRPDLKDFQTRFLFPFALDPQRLRMALSALRAAKFFTRNGESHDLWHRDQSRDWCSPYHPVYRDEMLGHVADYLFPEPGSLFSDPDHQVAEGGPAPVAAAVAPPKSLSPDRAGPETTAQGCAYLQVADAVAHKWFHGFEVFLSGGTTMPVEVVGGVGIELFPHTPGGRRSVAGPAPRQAGTELR